MSTNPSPASKARSSRKRPVVLTAAAVVTLLGAGGIFFSQQSKGNSNGPGGVQCNGTCGSIQVGPGVAPAPLASTTPPLADGVATITGVRSQDNQPGIPSRVLIAVNVQSLPTNGNELFLACSLLDKTSNANQIYVHTQITNKGPGEYPVAFGANAVDSKIMIKTRRTCGVVTANPQASSALSAVAGIDKPLTGTVGLPPGSSFLGTVVEIQITRLNQFN